jgi:hypothetical protein
MKMSVRFALVILLFGSAAGSPGAEAATFGEHDGDGASNLYPSMLVHRGPNRFHTSQLNSLNN